MEGPDKTLEIPESLKEEMVAFVDSYPGISWSNFNLLYGKRVHEYGLTMERINSWTNEKIQKENAEDSFTALPTNVFDGVTVDITKEYVASICEKVARLGDVDPIVLKPEEDLPYQDYLKTDVDTFDISKLNNAYDLIKSTGDTVSKIREMLADFQPMFLERFSDFILDRFTVDGKKIFGTLTEFIKAFTNAAFFEEYSKLPSAPPLQQLTTVGNTWQGHFGPIQLTIHVSPGRMGTGASGKINTGNVIQAALFYKNRRNDFVRSNSAISMIKHCPTSWGKRESGKKGTTYTFTDLYNGELIAQKYEGNLPDVAVEGVPFVSILERTHEAGNGRVFTNQEHIAAVYPISCILRSDCYYETLVYNLQMISQFANNAVNSKRYESPIGKLLYQRDTHLENDEQYIGEIYAKKIELCLQANPDLLPSIRSAAGQNVLRLQAQIKDQHLKIQDLTDKLGTNLTTDERAQLNQEKGALEKEIGAYEKRIGKLEKAAKIEKAPETDDALTKFKDFEEEKEYHTRKALLMARLKKIEDCCLDITNERDKVLIADRRAVVLSCIDSVATIIDCAKISITSTAMPKSMRAQFVKDSNELNNLRALTSKLFYDYQRTKAKYATSTQQEIDATLEIFRQQQDMLTKTKLLIIENATLRCKNEKLEAMKKKSDIFAEINNELLNGFMTGSVTIETKNQVHNALVSARLEEINAIDHTIAQLVVRDNIINEDAAYVLNHLSEFGDIHGQSLLETAEHVNSKVLGLLDNLSKLTGADIDSFTEMIANPSQPHAALTVGFVELPNKEDLLESANLQVPSALLSTICPSYGEEPRENANLASVSTMVATNLLDQNDAQYEALEREMETIEWETVGKKISHIIRKKSRMSADLKMSAMGVKEVEGQAQLAQEAALFTLKSKLLTRQTVEGPASSQPKFLRWAGRCMTNAQRERARIREQKSRMVQQIHEKREEDGIQSFLYFFSCNNHNRRIQDKSSIEMIKAYLESNGDLRDKIMAIKSRMSTAAVAEGVVHGGKLTPLLNPDEILEQLQEALRDQNKSKLFSLYIDYFDTEWVQGELSVVMNQVYSILMSDSIYVPLYRCEPPKDFFEELANPMFEKRKSYTGDFNDFDTLYADSFCIQVFGKSVNELLHDLSKGKLNIPRGVFPNICYNPFEPYSLICTLEFLRYLCLALPFAQRLHFYFAGILSFMGETYSVNMEEIQVDAILSKLEQPNFYASFDKAAATATEANEAEAEATEANETTTEAEAAEAMAAKDLPPPPDKRLGMSAGTRKRRKRTLSKRLKKNKTKRLHGLYIRD